MTLLVCAYKRLADGSIEWLAESLPGSDLAGFESMRQTFWGSDSAKGLGLVLLPTLASADIWAEGTDLDVLETEIAILSAHLDTVAEQQDYWLVRLANVKNAIGRAKRVPARHGGVYIG
jgi:hypothetical protein